MRQTEDQIENEIHIHIDMHIHIYIRTSCTEGKGHVSSFSDMTAQSSTVCDIFFKIYVR